MILQVIIEYKLLEKESIHEMIQFMEIVDSDFKPPLKERAVFRELIDKILVKGYCYAAFHKNRIIGAIMFYCNDLDSKRAYINYFAVLSEHRRNGIGCNLMGYSINKSVEMGMVCIGVHTWRTNKGTLDTYNRMGFNIIDDGIGVNRDRVFLEKFLV